MWMSSSTCCALSLATAAALSGACSEQAQPDEGMPAAAQAGSAAQAPECTEPESGLPSDVFCTGLYRDHNATRYAATARPYTPGVTLWSDGADKQRFLYLPPGSTIDTSNVDAWMFPVGTRAWKEFRFDGKLVETRLFWKRDERTWESGTYVWNADQTAASLNSSRTPLLLPSGYEIPTAKDCGKCHHGGADKLLGLEAVALALPSARGLTLERLASEGALSHPPALLSITLPEDTTGLAGAALGYLHANCGMPCHSSRGLGHETELLMRLRADEYWPQTGAAATPNAANTQSYLACVNQAAVTGAVTSAFPDALRIVSGQHEHSLVWLLAHRRGEYQMPPLVSHRVDEDGMSQLAAWIDALPAR
jgi:hypothetical protein